MSKYPEAYSDVTVTFMDGEVKTYQINAGAGIGRYLASEAAANGFLSLFNSKTGESWAIPVVNIRDWSLREVYRESVADTPAEPVAEKSKSTYVSVRDAVLAILKANPEIWLTSKQIVRYVEQVCPNVDVPSGVSTTLGILVREGFAQKFKRGYKIAYRGQRLVD